MSETVSTSEAVRIYSIHPATVLRLILTDKVEASKDINGRWQITRASLDKWNRARSRKSEGRA